LKFRNRCPVCGATSFTNVYEEPFSGPGIRAYLQRHYEGKASTAADASNYSLVRCNDCRLVYQAHVPDEQLLAEIYNHWVPGGQQLADGSTLAEYRYLAEQVQFVIEHFGVPPSDLRVLDFGFGWGQFAKMAMGFGCKVAGVELSRERIRDAQRAGLEVLEGKDLPKSTFRFVNTEQVFEHLLEPGAVLQELVESLTDDGVIKISVPDSSAALRQLRREGAFAKLEANQQLPIAPLEHINCFDHKSLVAMGRKAGLRPIRPRFRHMLNSSSGLFHPRSFAKAMARPIYRHVFPRTTIVYFGRA
jgi:2-polyprenyl-3-methyl-5-hydroxy-6-metoxy-1,4-benzoquinol methylase